jgi:hypothetical protein
LDCAHVTSERVRTCFPFEKKKSVRTRALTDRTTSRSNPKRPKPSDENQRFLLIPPGTKPTPNQNPSRISPPRSPAKAAPLDQQPRRRRFAGTRVRASMRAPSAEFSWPLRPGSPSTPARSPRRAVLTRRPHAPHPWMPAADGRTHAPRDHGGRHGPLHSLPLSRYSSQLC